MACARWMKRSTAGTCASDRSSGRCLGSGSERDYVNAIGEVMHQFPGDLEREARFAHSSRAGEGEQAGVWAQEQRAKSLHLVLTANELCRRDREGRCGKLGFVTWRGLRKDDDVVLHRRSLFTSRQWSRQLAANRAWCLEYTIRSCLMNHAP